MKALLRRPQPAAEPKIPAKTMKYNDFMLSIEAWADGEYKISTQSDESGEVSHKVRFPLDRPEFRTRVDVLEGARRGIARDMQVHTQESGILQTVTDHGELAKQFGQELFDIVLSGSVLTQFRVAQNAAENQSKGLRVRLKIEPPELASLPWEFLFDTEGRDYLAISAKTPVTRYLPLAQARKQLTVKPPLRILGLAASPGDHAKLNIDHERARIDRATQVLRDEGVLELKWLEEPTRTALQQTLARSDWHVFHFIGHGGFDPAAGEDGEGLILLAEETDEGLLDNSRSYHLYASDLGTMLAEHSVRLAVLNSCEGAKAGDEDIFSSTASTLMHKGVPSVVAMQYEITDDAAVEFASSLYGHLSGGVPVDGAVTRARLAIRMKSRNTLEWATPVLHMRSKDGKLIRTGPLQIGPTDTVGLSWMAVLTLASVILGLVFQSKWINDGVLVEYFMLPILIGVGVMSASNPETKVPALVAAGFAQPLMYALVLYFRGESQLDDLLNFLILALMAGGIAFGAWWARRFLSAMLKRKKPGPGQATSNVP